MHEESDYAIRNLAYELWEKAGRPPGEHLQFWYAASRQIKAEGDREGVGRTQDVPESADANVRDDL